MRTSLKSVLAGAAAIVAVGAGTTTFAREVQSHVMTVRLPDGSVEQIQYTGDTPPQVVVAPAPVAIATPFFGPQAGFGPSFAELQRISAILDQQAAAMMRQIAAIPTMTGAAIGDLPPGASGYSYIATSSGNGVCTRSVQITYRGGDAKPQMVSHTSGNCGTDQEPAVPSGLSAPPPATAPQLAEPHRTIEVKADGRKPYLAMAQPVTWDR